MPVAALAGLLVVVGLRMLDRESLHYLASRQTILDFAVIATVVLVALSVGLIAASGAGILLAIALFVREQVGGHEGAVAVAADGDVVAVGDAEADDLVDGGSFGAAGGLLAARELEAGAHRHVRVAVGPCVDGVEEGGGARVERHRPRVQGADLRHLLAEDVEDVRLSCLERRALLVELLVRLGS